MQDRIGLIEAEYDRRLNEWRATRMRFTVGTNQFNVDYGRNACTAAAAAAVLYVLSYIAPKPGLSARDVMPNLPWETIVETGARLWCEYAMSPEGERNPSGHVEFDQLLACGGEFCTTVKRALEVINEIAGHTDDGVVRAMDAGALPKTLCETIETIPALAAAVITATSVDIHGDGHGVGAAAAATARGPSEEVVGVGVTLAVLHVSDEYWVYDSHGAVDTDAGALLCCCETAETAADLLREQLPTGLYCATIVKRRRLSPK